MKKVIFCILSFLLTIMLSSCSDLITNQKDSISIIGNFNDEVEIGTIYEDPGINIPNGYYLKKEEGIKLPIVGKEYEIKYKVYSPSGELVKELSRYVKYVDTTGPTYETTDIERLTAGKEYKLSDFIADYNDNSTDKSSIVISSDLPKIFSISGNATINIEFKDKYGNTTTYNETFHVVFDLNNIINYWKNQKLIKTTNSSDGKKLEINAGSNLKFEYYQNTKTLYMYKYINSELGSKVYISIFGATNNFKNTNIVFNVYNNGLTSTGKVVIDGTKNYYEMSFNKFDELSNRLKLDESRMLEEFNKYFLDFNAEFNMYKHYDWESLF